MDDIGIGVRFLIGPEICFVVTSGANQCPVHWYRRLIFWWYIGLDVKLAAVFLVYGYVDLYSP